MSLIERLEKCHPSLARGLVWCRHCKRGPVKVDNGLANGWPKCCGYTMTIDSPAEQVALKARAALDKKERTV